MPGAADVLKEALNGSLTPALCSYLYTKETMYYTFAETFLPPARAQQFFGTMGAAYNMLCNRKPPSDEPLPFNGGQCPVQYTITSVARLRSIGDPTLDDPLTRTDILPGPIYGIRGIVVSNGLIQRVVIDFQSPSGPAEFTLYGTSNLGYLLDFGITSIARVDGQPDNCGNPARPVPPDPPPGSNITNTTITYTDSTGSTITAPITITFGKGFIDVNGQVNINASININNDFDIDAVINFHTGEISYGVSLGVKGNLSIGSGGISSSNVVTITPIPPSGVDPGNGNPDPREDRRIVGVLVTVTDPPTGRATTIGQDENPDIFAPRLGNVNFLCRIGTSLSGGWSGDIAVKNRRHLIQCPWDEGAIDVKGTPEPGVTWVLTPIYAAAKVPAGL